MKKLGTCIKIKPDNLKTPKRQLRKKMVYHLGGLRLERVVQEKIQDIQQEYDINTLGLLQREFIWEQSFQSSSSEAKYRDLEAIWIIACVEFSKNIK